MNYLPFSPLFRLISLFIVRGGIPIKLLPHIAPWLVKCILLEPFRWVEMIAFERKIKNHKIEKAPIFILGHYRSGTTYLQRIFMQFPNLGRMTIFQSGLPEIMLIAESWLTPVLQKFSRLFKVQNHFHRIPLEWDFPGEEDVGHAALLEMKSSHWGVLFPSYFHKDFEKYVLFETASPGEKVTWIETYLYLVKKLSLANNGKQLVLKSPPNTARIELLQQIFPGALFIFLHRNPYEVFASSQRFWKVILDQYAFGPLSKEMIEEIIGNQYIKMMDKYLEAKSRICAENLVEISYEELVERPLTVVKGIFKQMAIPGWEMHEALITSFTEKNKEHSPLIHNLPEETEKWISEHWGKYILTWNYSFRNT